MLTIKENITYTQEIAVTKVQKDALHIAATIIGELLTEYPTTGEFDQERIVLGTVKDVLSGLTSEKPFVDISSVAEQDFDWSAYDVKPAPKKSEALDWNAEIENVR